MYYRNKKISIRNCSLIFCLFLEIIRVIFQIQWYLLIGWELKAGTPLNIATGLTLLCSVGHLRSMVLMCCCVEDQPPMPQTCVCKGDCNRLHWIRFKSEMKTRLTTQWRVGGVECLCGRGAHSWYAQRHARHVPQKATISTKKKWNNKAQCEPEKGLPTTYLTALLRLSVGGKELGACLKMNQKG